MNPGQEKQEFNSDYLAISACAELVEENCIESAFSAQDLTVLTTIDEALQDPTWKKSMNEEYEALIEKKYGSYIATS